MGKILMQGIGARHHFKRHLIGGKKNIPFHLPIANNTVCDQHAITRLGNQYSFNVIKKGCRACRSMMAILPGWWVNAWKHKDEDAEPIISFRIERLCRVSCFASCYFQFKSLKKK